MIDVSVKRAVTHPLLSPRRRTRGAWVAVWASLIVIWAITATGQEAVTVSQEPIHAAGIKFRFASLEQAKAILGQEDPFIQSLSPFDRQARMRTQNDPGTAAFVAFVVKQAIEWTPAEQHTILKAIELLGEQLGDLRLSVPEPIWLVHTTGREESGAAYTRGSAIVLPRGMTGSLERPPVRLIAHELFHVLSRTNPQLRDKLYAIIGFRPTGEIRLPERLALRRITNPDAPQISHAIDVRLSDEKSVMVAPVLLARSEFDPRQSSLFSYLDFKLLEVVQDGDAKWITRLVNGEAVLLVPSLPDFHRQIGGNTGYIIHPDEVLADNFVILLTGESVKDQWIVDRMREMLSKAANESDSGF